MRSSASSKGTAAGGRGGRGHGSGRAHHRGRVARPRASSAAIPTAQLTHVTSPTPPHPRHPPLLVPCHRSITSDAERLLAPSVSRPLTTVASAAGSGAAAAAAGGAATSGACLEPSYPRVVYEQYPEGSSGLGGAPASAPASAAAAAAKGDALHFDAAFESANLRRAVQVSDDSRLDCGRHLALLDRCPLHIAWPRASALHPHPSTFTPHRSIRTPPSAPLHPHPHPHPSPVPTPKPTSRTPHRLPSQVGPREYSLVVNCDVNTRGHTQWFLYRVRNMEAGVP